MSAALFGCLKGVRVLDLSRYLPGPLATLWLADFGAEVVKIEPPGGEGMRMLGPRDAQGRGLWHAALNANKRIVTLDLTQADGRETLSAWLDEADVLVESFRPGVLDRLGLAPAEADRVWREIDAGVQAAVRSLTPQARLQQVYFEVSPAPYGASESSFIGETLQRLGVRNILPAALGPFPQINPEFVVRAQPDVIMAGDSSRASMLQRPGWPQMRAVREDRICVFAPGQADLVVRPGPRMAEGARLMAQCLNRTAGGSR